MRPTWEVVTKISPTTPYGEDAGDTDSSTRTEHTALASFDYASASQPFCTSLYIRLVAGSLRERACEGSVHAKEACERSVRTKRAKATTNMGRSEPSVGRGNA